MTQEEKQLLIKDICSRLPYGVYVKFQQYDDPLFLHMKDALVVYNGGEMIDTIQYLYLRPMSSMTEEEQEAYDRWHEELEEGRIKDWKYAEYNDWINAHHLDYRGLIEKCLALEAPADMYKNE